MPVITKIDRRHRAPVLQVTVAHKSLGWTYLRYGTPRWRTRGTATVPGASDLPPFPKRHFRRLPSLFDRFRNLDAASRVTPFVILTAAAFEAVVMAIDYRLGGGVPIFRALAFAGLPVIFASAWVLQRAAVGQNRDLQALCTGLETALQARQTAEAANLAKARYLANVSHEIRSPLNAIYGYAQLIEQDGEVRPKHAARVIRRCAEDMTSMVESLLDLSRMENGLLRVRSEIVPLPEFLEQIVLMMRPAAKAKGLEFIYEAPVRLPEYVRADPHRLRQVLINLIGNAIKFTEEGSVTFRLRYHGQIATFTISDTGPGIAPEDQERIFDPYERVAGSDQQMRAGVGLGLPITKAIVQILGGNLELESELGRGASFRVTVMLGEPMGALVADAPERRIIGYEGPARSILLVEDSADQRGFFEQFLASCGFEVVALPNGESAVDLCAARRFDLAVLDISLPGISGWETAARIREQLGQDIMIVMASANADEFHRPDYDRPMHDQFLTKPFRLDQMAEVIGALLNISWKWEATADVAAQPPTRAEAAHGGLSPAALTHVERLQERIRIGHVRGIEAEITLLAEAAPDHRELIDGLYAALDKFDLTGMSRLLGGE